MTAPLAWRICLEAPGDEHTNITYYPVEDGEDIREAGIRVIDHMLQNVVRSWADGSLVSKYQIEKALQRGQS